MLLFVFETEQDESKFNYLYTKYKNLLLHKAYSILQDSMLAEDAVSEAYIRIYKNLHKIDDPTTNQSVAFIVTIVKNTALTILSKSGSKEIELIDDLHQDDFDLESYVISEISAANILEILDQVNEEYKSVFLLKYAYQCSHKEISLALGISENNVTVRLHRAKKKISMILEKEGYLHEARV